MMMMIMITILDTEEEKGASLMTYSTLIN
jgi:hypothetical protein